MFSNKLFKPRGEIFDIVNVKDCVKCGDFILYPYTTYYNNINDTCLKCKENINGKQTTLI